MNELEEIKNKIDMVEYVGKYVQLKQSGRNFKGLCPFHTEKTPSFMVSPEKQIWHCFGCNEGGDVITFAEKIEGLTFPEAIKELAQRAGVKLPQNFSQRREPTEKLLEINEQVCAFYEKKLREPEGKKALDYLKKRGLAEKTIKDFRLGFSPAQGEVVAKELTTLGYQKEDLIKAGIANVKNSRVIDQFRNRLMFPIANVQGKIIGFSARVLDPSAGSGQAYGPKYINTPETPIYHKSSILFGFVKAKEQTRKQDHIILVEGNMDVIFSCQAGVKNVAAASGTALTESQLDLIRRFTRNIKISFDVDLAGQSATRRAIELAQDKGLNIKVIEVPEGKDPADLVKSDPKKWINACKKAKYVVDYIFDSTFEKYNLANILDKKRVTRELLATISRLPDPVEKEHYLQILSSRVGVSLRALTDALRKAKSTTPTRNVGTPTESVEEAKPKPRSLEEHVISLLLATPNFADFFFNKLRPADFIEPRLIGFADELSKMKEKSGEIDLATWQKNQSKEDQTYIKSLILRIEDEFGELNEEKLGEEIFNSVLRLRHNNFSRAKKDLSSQIQAVEKSGDKEKLKKMMTEFQKLVERERNV